MGYTKTKTVPRHKRGRPVPRKGAYETTGKAVKRPPMKGT
jgi:hypothetical protein